MTAVASPPADQHTRDLVSHDGLGQTLFVEAGAGTGKTTQLVERIVSLVLGERVGLAEMAAITFTEAAAAELQSRVRVAFEKRAQSTTDDLEAQRCRQAIADVDLAALSTLHGFASRLLGEFAIEAGLPPQVRVLDEVSSQLAHEERWTRFVDELYDDAANESLLVRAALLKIAFEPQYQGHATLKDVAAELNDNWDRLIGVAQVARPPLAPVDFTAFDDAVRTLCTLPDLCSDPDDKFCQHLTERLLPELSDTVAIADPDRKLAALASRPKWGPGSGGRNDAWSGDAKSAKDHVRAVTDAADAIVAAAADDVLGRLLVLICAEVVDSAESRRRDGGLEFHDLLVLARNLLRTSTDARQRLHQRFTHILLDEFQDTDPIQIELAILIASSTDGPLPDRWTELSIDAGRLFFVGDPKQSIYRFRRADIGLFLEARDHFGPSGSWARLTTNFRTVAPVLDWVNALFGQVMADEKPGSQPGYEPLDAWRSPPDPVDHRPVLLGGPHPDPKVRADELRDIEAADVAAVITHICECPDAWLVEDQRSGEWRPARLSDVTILVPTRTSLPFLREKLDQAGVPYRLATGTLVYDTQEVRDALAALRAIDDPTDQLSLVAALRSPLFACSDVDLFTYREADGRWDLRADPPDQVPADHPVRAALVDLRALWRERWWLSPSVVLERLLRDREAFLLGFGDPRPTEVWRRLRFLLDQARAFEEAEGGDLRGFLDWAALQGADAARVHEPLLPETDDESVRILTIHGSKGLEFPITILSGMTTKPGGRRQGVSLLWGDTGFPEVSLRKGVATANHEPRIDLEIEMDADEKLRLLYVAATRARDHLIVSVHHKEGKADTYAGQMSTFFADHPTLCRAGSDLDGVVAPHDEPRDEARHDRDRVDERAGAPPVDDRDEWITARQALLEPHRTPRVASATAVARAMGLTLTDDGDDDRGDQPDDATVPLRRRGRAGSAVGRAVHACLQVLDLAEPTDLDAQVGRQCEVEAIPDLAGVVAALVRSALDADVVRSATHHPHHKELYVAAPVGRRVIEGYIDLLVETPTGLVVVDYKTDAARSEAEIDAKLAGYRLQGAAYAVALEVTTKQPVIDCRFVFCRSGGAVERSVVDLEGAKAQVRSLLDDRAVDRSPIDG